MSLDWGSFFNALGQGLGQYGSYKAQEQTDAEEREFRNRQLELTRSGQEAEARYRTDQLAATERQRQQDAAQHRADELAKAGIVDPSGEYTRNAMAAEMPETPGYDAGGMAINAVRNAGRARTQELEQAGPAAVNEGYRKRQLMTPIPGTHAFAFMEPGTLSNLDVAKSNADVAAANRKSAHEIALIRATAQGQNRSDPVEMQRLRFMQKGMSDRMKPPLDQYGLPTAKAMGQAQAYRETRAAWEMVKNNLEVPTGSAKGTPAMPSDSFATHQDASFDPMAVAAELQGVDADTAREILEANNYTDEEVDQVLGQLQ